MVEATDVSAGRPATTFRLAELVAALSLGIDLGFGQPMEHVLRQCLIALRLAERLELDEKERAAVYYTALLVNVGCHADAYEQAKWFGDDIEAKSHKYDHEPRSLRGVAAAVRMIGRGTPAFQRFRVGIELALSGHRDLTGMMEQHAELARALAQELALPEAVQEAVAGSYEQWDGKGWPGRLGGDAIPIASRIAQVAEYTEVAYRFGGVEAVERLARRRSGSQLDPQLCALLATEATAILGGLESTPAWQTVIDAEPALNEDLSGDGLDNALLGVATFVDLKSPYTLGHARAVAELSAAAGGPLGLGGEEAQTLRRSALVLGLGRLGVSNAIWDKQGPLGAADWERVRIFPYLTERMLHQSHSLAPLGDLAVQHRERLDGSGYPRALVGRAIAPLALVLGAADAYQSMREPRPYRDALSADAAAKELRAEVTAGRMDIDAVEAVLAAAGQPSPRRRERPGGLTAREVQVLRLVAQGLSSRQIAHRLVIAPKTARNHIEHIYTKIGASSRATASLYAMQYGLLPEQVYPAPHR